MRGTALRWPLVAALALPGGIIGAASLWGWTRDREPWLWLLSFGLAAYLLARRAPGSPFRHGVAAGAGMALLHAAIQVAFFSRYLASNPDPSWEAGVPAGIGPRMFAALTALPAAAVTGVVVGGMTVIAGWLYGRPSPPAPGPSAASPPAS